MQEDKSGGLWKRLKKEGAGDKSPRELISKSKEESVTEVFKSIGKRKQS